MIAAMEHLVFDEVVRGVELAFQLNDIDLTEALDNDGLTEILKSFLITEMLEGTTDKDKHMRHKRDIHRRYPFWSTTVLYVEDTVGSDFFQRQSASNPFAKQ